MECLVHPSSFSLTALGHLFVHKLMLKACLMLPEQGLMSCNKSPQCCAAAMPAMFAICG